MKKIKTLLGLKIDHKYDWDMDGILVTDVYVYETEKARDVALKKYKDNKYVYHVEPYEVEVFDD